MNQNPQLLSVSEAAEQLGIGRSTAFELIKAGTLRSVKIGSRRLISAQAIADFIATLEHAQSESA